MEAIGSYLKEIRQSKGISIGKASKETKILLEHLVQIENNEFHKISGSTYIKGFLKKYGEFLGLNGEVLIQEYSKQYEDKKENLSLLSNYQKMELSLLAFESWVPRIKKIILFILIITAAGFGFKFFPVIKKPLQKIINFKSPSPTVVNKPNILNDIEAIEKQSTNKKSSSTSTNTENTTELVSETKTAEMNLTARPLNNVWLSLKIDGRLIFEDILKKGDEEHWKAGQSFAIKVNQPQNILLFYNNQPIARLKEYHTPKNITISNHKIKIHD